jgi:hypothetical protein
MIHSCDDIIWLMFSGWSQKVPLAFVVAVVVLAPQVTILTPREPLPHLLLLFGPIVHHIMKAHNSLRPVPPEIPVDAWVGDAVVEAVDDVVLRDVRDGGADVEETTCVGPQELVSFLFALGKVVMSTCASDRPLEVIDEDLLEALPGVDGVAAEALQPRERHRVQSHREVDDFGDVRPPCDLAETCRESRESIATVSTFGFDFFAGLAPVRDHGPRIAAFIDALAQVFWRKSMIGLSRVTPWWWLLPPARSLTPASVVVAGLVLRAATCRLAVSLATTLTHALLPDGGRRVVLIQLDPGPLCVQKCLAHIRIMTALENGRHPGDVGHRSPEPPFACGGELRVKLAMHRSPTLVGPPPPDCAGPVPGPPRLTIGVILIAGIGCDLIFGDCFKVNDGKIPIVLAFFCH